MRGSILVATAIATTVHAQAPDKAAGAAAFRVGAQAFKANRFDVAVLLFEQAYAVDPRPETAFSIAQANRLQYVRDTLGWRLVRAVQLYQAYLAELPTGPRAKDASERILELAPIVLELKRRGELVPYVPPIRTQLVVGAEVDAATVTIDGTSAALWQPTDVASGVHEVTVTAEGYEVARRTVRVAAGSFVPIDVPLVSLPARLSIETEDGATVYIDGRVVDGRDAIAVPHGTRFVSVTRRGRRAFSVALDLERGRATRLDASLEPTSQRKLANIMLVSGAVLGAATGGAAVWSYVARRDARRLDDARLALGATPADLARYNARVHDVETRDRLAAGLGIAAVAVTGLGVAMWLFDHESPGRPRFDVTPDGIQVRGSF